MFASHIFSPIYAMCKENLHLKPVQRKSPMLTIFFPLYLLVCLKLIWIILVSTVDIRPWISTLSTQWINIYFELNDINDHSRHDNRSMHTIQSHTHTSEHTIMSWKCVIENYSTIRFVFCLLLIFSTFKWPAVWNALAAMELFG